MDAVAVQKVVEDVTRIVQTEGNTRAIFGEPLQLETHKVIPVAVIEIGIGGGGAGAGRANKMDAGVRGKLGEWTRRLIPFGFGGGMGGGVKVRPVGFLHEKDGQVVYTTIA